MALKKRVRFEILRRDNFTCRYCGSKAPDVRLHVDHVIPRRHGGTDDLWNLTAACMECNIAKLDGMPHADIISQVREDHTYYQSSHGLPIYACVYCSKPIQRGLDEEAPTECETCNEIACNGYEAGLRKGLSRGLV